MRTPIRFLRVGAALAAAVLLTGCSRRPSTRALDPVNELPQGVVDGPRDGDKVSTMTQVGGWAIDDRGVKEVRIYVDGHYNNVTPLNTSRPDVVKAYPQYGHGSDVVGYTTVVEFPGPGPHTIVVQAVDTDGATRDLGAVKVTVGG